MTDGLVTRIGKWIDHRWETKATESMVLERWNSLENAAIKDKVELIERIDDVKTQAAALEKDLKMVMEARGNSQSEKDVADLKARLEKLELYCGMTRKVDPTKPPVVKSAFQM
jgi:hypothetical protein